ncbi:MAG: hypothetical protein VKO19_01310 [Cyanobacteriota bacterium]|jgi:hypothetical protein|nr:hypothetical protein [Cyanobacteriota bacterium]
MHAPAFERLQTHLPTRQQTLFYVLILIASPILNLLVSSLVFRDVRQIALKGAHGLGSLNWFFGISSFLMGCLLLLLGLNLAHTLLGHHPRHSRKSLFAYGVVSSLYLLINLLTISYGIFAFKVQSLLLLVVSICSYLALNILFVFWYWFVDYPSQIRRLHHPESTPELCFPSNSHTPPNWLPNVFDYLYFAVLTSNTLGPPESHSPAGPKARAVVLVHSLVMLVVLVIFVSRAINTLS